jgi:hypothetical protein
LERDGWSEFSEENSRSPVSRQISRKIKGVTMSISKGSNLRRSRTIDPSHKGRWIYTWISISGFRRWKSCKLCNRNRDIMKHKVPKAKKIMWATIIGRWTGGTLSTQSQTSLTISSFHGVKIQIPCIRIWDIAKSKVMTEVKGH